MPTYSQVVDSVEALPEDQQETLLALMQRRLADRRRQTLARGIEEARKELKAGKIRPAAPSAIMTKVLA